MDARFAGCWVNADGNLLIIKTRGSGRFGARFVRRDGKVPLWRRFLTRFGMPAFGLYGSIREDDLEIEIGQGRALRLRFDHDQEGELLLPEIVPGIADLDDWRRTVRIRWLEPLSCFRREPT
jgi:hypothetical protein